MTTLKRFTQRFISFQPKLTAISFVVMLLSSLLQGVGLLLLIPMVGMISDQEGSHLPGVLDKLFPVAWHDMTLLQLLIAYVALVATAAFINSFNARLTTKLQLNLASYLRMKLATVYIQLSWLELMRVKRSDISNLITMVVERVSAGGQLLLRIVSTGVLSCVYFVTAIMISLKLTLIASAAGVVIFFLLRHQQTMAKIYGGNTHQGYRDIFSLVTDKLNSIKLVKAYGNESLFLEDLAVCNKAVAESKYLSSRLMAVNSLSYTLYGAVGFSIFFYCAATYFSVTWSSLLVLLVIFSSLLSKIATIQKTLQNLVNVMPSYEMMEKAISDYELRQEPEFRDDGVAFSLEKQISVDDIQFQYHGATSKVFDKQSFVIPAKKVTALVAPSGFGKTTLVDTVLGLISPDSGCVTIDNIKLTPENKYAWQQHIAYVPQDPLFFNGTLRENLCWGCGEVPDEAIWNALAMAQADQFVLLLSGQLDAPMSDFAINFSGGEKQRIMLARAFLRQPKLLVLDEATSALDQQNESIIFDTIKGLKHQVTVIIISHRLKTLDWVDHVIDLEHYEREFALVTDELGV